jgi:molybdopterin synthase catalytic subunit
MRIELRDSPFDPWEELQRYRKEQPQVLGKAGATSVFAGHMRDFNEGDPVTGMYLEHYPAMTSAYLEKIAREAREKWDILDVLMLHRYGEITPADCIVLLAVWSAHREEAFSACRYLIEELKIRAPFWKKETLLADNQTRWVKGKSTLA